MAEVRYLLPRLDSAETGARSSNRRLSDGSGPLANQSGSVKKAIPSPESAEENVNMKHTERVKAIADELNLPVSAVNEVWGALAAAMTLQLSKNQDVIRSRFFTASVFRRAARNYWDDRAGRMKAGKSWKDVKITIHEGIKLRLKNRGFGP